MAESLFIRADEVIRLLGVSKSEAYRIIKRLNDEMASKGYTRMHVILLKMHKLVLTCRLNLHTCTELSRKRQTTPRKNVASRFVSPCWPRFFVGWFDAYIPMAIYTAFFTI